MEGPPSPANLEVPNDICWVHTFHSMGWAYDCRRREFLYIWYILHYVPETDTIYSVVLPNSAFWVKIWASVHRKPLSAEAVKACNNNTNNIIV